MTVILVDPRRPTLIPVEAVELLAGEVQYTEEMPVKVPWSLSAARPVLSGVTHDDRAPVLLSSDPAHPAVLARVAAGERVISAPEPQAGERLVDAVAMMDTLRSTGPWESEQTHDSLRRYLLEETYELFDAVRSGNLDELPGPQGPLLAIAGDRAVRHVGLRQVDRVRPCQEPTHCRLRWSRQCVRRDFSRCR